MKHILIIALAFIGWSAAGAGPVNVNTADAEAISRELTGIGMAKAEAIVEYRKQHGAFDVPEALLKVKGIGPRVLAANRDNIRVTDE
ncbi:MAG: helix-hairpin-helix domain-containing protein [Gammaproteobacteria bacterium]|jgi:competence protein ComEA|nr:helix-hairpin-helix domain-containing protein [Gammaproteobacteria bacterium]